VAATLPDRLGEPVQERSVFDPELLGRGNRLAGDERQGDVRLGVFLLGVLEVAGEPEVGVIGDGGETFGDSGVRLGDQFTSSVELEPVRRSDRVRACPDRAAGRGKCVLARGRLRVETEVDRAGQVLEIHALRRRPSSSRV
jgi:hypothetical protein